MCMQALWPFFTSARQASVIANAGCHIHGCKHTRNWLGRMIGRRRGTAKTHQEVSFSSFNVFWNVPSDEARKHHVSFPPENKEERNEHKGCRWHTPRYSERRVSVYFHEFSCRICKTLWSKSTLNEATSKVYSDCNVKQLSNDDTYAALSSYSKSH